MATYIHRATQPYLIFLSEDENGVYAEMPCTNFGNLPEDPRERLAIFEAAKRLFKMKPEEIKRENEIANANEEARWLKLNNEANLASEKRERKTRHGFVYLAFDEPRRVFKVGFSKNPNGREQQLKTANAGVRFLQTWKAIEDDEKFIHKTLRERGRNISGEWYNLERVDIEFLVNHFSTSRDE